MQGQPVGGSSPPHGSASARTAASLEAGVAALWERFRGSVLARIEALEDAALALLGGTLDEELRRRAEREAHKLAGAVGTFGFPAASRVARSVELLLAGNGPLTSEDALRLSTAAVELRELLEAPAPRQERPTAAHRPTLLIVSEDRDLVERTSMEAEGRGLDVRHVTVAAWAEAVSGTGPAAVVLDLGVERGSAHALNFLERLRGMAPAPATVVIADHDSLQLRVDVAQRGATRFLRKPVAPARILDSIQHVQGTCGLTGSRIMLVDDDTAVLGLVSAMLSSYGAEVSTVCEPLRFWEELSRVGPDLVVLDHDMPHFSGPDICRALRADPRWQALPIIFLTGRRDAGTVQQMFAAGADDYLQKPVIGTELLTRLRNRLDRATAAATSGRGAVQRATAEAERLFQLAARKEQPVALARLEPDDLERVSASLGSTATREVLARIELLLTTLLPAGDLVMGSRNGEFLVVCYGETADSAAVQVRAAVAAIGREQIIVDGTPAPLAFSAGIASCPGDGEDFAAVREAAGTALLHARQAGGARVVVRSAAMVGNVDLIDVAIVEDDRLLADLLSHALGTRGYQTRVMSDGEEALALLAGDTPSVRARVVLLDVDLPGRSGLSVLRELARAGVLKDTDCVMLTVRSSEAEVLQSMELGAVDHVAKPFSVHVLLHRLQRLLDRV